MSALPPFTPNHQTEYIRQLAQRMMAQHSQQLQHHRTQLAYWRNVLDNCGQADDVVESNVAQRPRTAVTFAPSVDTTTPPPHSDTTPSHTTPTPTTPTPSQPTDAADYESEAGEIRRTRLASAAPIPSLHLSLPPPPAKAKPRTQCMSTTTTTTATITTPDDTTSSDAPVHNAQAHTHSVKPTGVHGEDRKASGDIDTSQSSAVSSSAVMFATDGDRRTSQPPKGLVSDLFSKFEKSGTVMIAKATSTTTTTTTTTTTSNNNNNNNSNNSNNSNNDNNSNNNSSTSTEPIEVYRGITLYEYSDEVIKEPEGVAVNVHLTARERQTVYDSSGTCVQEGQWVWVSDVERRPGSSKMEQGYFPSDYVQLTNK